MCFLKPKAPPTHRPKQHETKAREVHRGHPKTEAERRAEMAERALREERDRCASHRTAAGESGMSHYDRIHYDPATGISHGPFLAPGITAGKLAGSVSVHGYRVIPDW